MKTTTHNRLSERAMLVHLRTSMWTGRSKDERVISNVCHTFQAEEDAGDWFTDLVPRAALQPVNLARMRCRHVYFKYILPWMDGGLRILPAVMYLKYKEEMRKAVMEYEAAVETFLKKYPTLIAQAQKRLGHLLDGRHLPTVAEIRYKFTIQESVLPMPEATDFRAQIGQDEIDEVRTQVTESIQNHTGQAMTELWNNLQTLVQKVAGTLKEPDKTFRDSLIGNLRDFCDTLPHYNLVGDTRLEEIRQETIKQIAELDPDELRQDHKVRKVASRRAQRLADKMNSIMETLAA